MPLRVPYMQRRRMPLLWKSIKSCKKGQLLKLLRICVNKSKYFSGKMRKCCLDAFRRRTSRHEQKLENHLDRTVSRLEPLCRQGQTRCAQAEEDVAEQLRRGQRDRALVNAETVIKERNMLDGFAIVESYCQLLKKPAFLDHKQKECPEELREAAAGLAYASLRCGDLPELRKIRRIFRSRFGRGFTTAVTKLRDNCGVGADLLRKFSTEQPSLETKYNVMREIAIEKGIEVDLAEIPVETVENPNLQRRTRQARATMGRLCAACLREPPGGEMYEDAGRQLALPQSLQLQPEPM